MKVLILGGAGMAGHMIRDYFSERPAYQVFYTTRDISDTGGIFLNINNANSAEEIIVYLKPDLVINCIGLLNHFAGEHPIAALQANSILPHQLEKLLSRQGGKLVHISTDCVFSGEKGSYTEADTPDGTSFYAQSKRLGEIHSDRHLTIRTSIIGPELKNNGIGLFSWFMKQTGVIQGYEKVIWNGVTTLELAKAIEYLIVKGTTGLYHLGSETLLSKNELLLLIQRIFNKTDVNIVPDRRISLNRTIVSTRQDAVYPLPSYETMLKELKQWMERHE
ncbi:SDR family oxidoreductase [Bacillus sp. FJAT-42376]|uniref:dTDP-4-dehydrorhamnose reductase family protein n=1 Tax=Bacillus sp. FJAT-42376 TaxID=2014076 RepID=UPI000F50AB77|nr:SDR family oxidoreductase [Bacillus sp. FJAT-42376]AZB43230.1 SDR family oxidoreductase [Bacillus sp. FJAT-42376]